MKHFVVSCPFRFLRSLHCVLHKSHDFTETSEGGFQTRPYKSRFFFAPFAFFAAILLFRLPLRRFRLFAVNLRFLFRSQSFAFFAANSFLWLRYR